MHDKESVFRQRMVERLSATDELNEPLRLDPLRGWPMIAAVLLLLLAASLWALKTSNPVTVESVGVVLRTPADLPDEPHRALLYGPFHQDVQIGQLVRLETMFGTPFKMQGQVIQLGRAPSLRLDMERDMGDPDLAEQLYSAGHRRRVLVRLLPTENAEPWDRQQVEATIEIGRRRPIEDLFPEWASTTTTVEPKTAEAGVTVKRQGGAS